MPDTDRMAERHWCRVWSGQEDNAVISINDSTSKENVENRYEDFYEKSHSPNMRKRKHFSPCSRSRILNVFVLSQFSFYNCIKLKCLMSPYKQLCRNKNLFTGWCLYSRLMCLSHSHLASSSGSVRNNVFLILDWNFSSVFSCIIHAALR